MEDFKNRLLEFIERQYGISVRAFEEMCNITNGTIGSIKVKGPSADCLSKISDKCPELNLNWLITGRGEMLNTKLSVSAKASGGSSANAILGNGNIIGDNSPSLSLRSENAVLKRENEILRDQIDFLKKLLTK